MSRIIDEQGRVFGKINIIDFLVVLFLSCLLPMFYFGYKIMAQQKPVEIKREYTNVAVSCLFVKIKDEDVKIISSWKGEKDEQEESVIRVIKLGKPQIYEYEFDVGDGKKIVKQDRNLKQINAFLEIRSEIKGRELYYNGALLKVGRELLFDIDGRSFKSTIVGIYSQQQLNAKEKMQDVDIYVTLKDLNLKTLEMISVGDKEVNGKGEVLAEILALGKVTNNALDVNLGDGTFIQAEDISMKQVSVRMRLKIKKSDNGLFYFKDKKMMHNQPLEFDMGKYKAWGILSNTFEVLSRLKEQRVSLVVKFSGIAPEMARVIRNGDAEKDATDKVVARIRNIVSNKPSQVLTIKEGEFIALNHPFQRDILLNLDVLCVEKDGVYYFKNYPVKMGNNIVFATDLYSISGVIVGMETRGR